VEISFSKLSRSASTLWPAAIRPLKLMASSRLIARIALKTIWTLEKRRGEGGRFSITAVVYGALPVGSMRVGKTCVVTGRVAVGVNVAVGVLDGVTVGVLDAVIVGVLLGSGVDVTEGVTVGMLVGLGSSVSVNDGVVDAVGASVPVAVAGGKAVGVCVGADVPVSVGEIV